MGYEIKFFYYKKKTEGIGYDTEAEPEVMKVSVGKQWDEVDLDEVAKSVFGQMAKRNILIVDAEIYEYTKKKISFKMKDDGISIKNRKFSYDITGAIKSETEGEAPAAQPHQALVVHQPIPPTNLAELPLEVQEEVMKMRQQQKQSAISERLKPILPPAGTPLRFEIYDPHPDLLKAAKAHRLAFTIGKKYPIFEERPDRRGVMFGMLYLVEDDNGNRRALNDKHFVPMQSLTNDFNDAPRPNHISRPAVDDNVYVHEGQSVQLPDIYTLGNRRR